jgi:hypothetical protein
MPGGCSIWLRLLFLGLNGRLADGLLGGSGKLRIFFVSTLILSDEVEPRRIGFVAFAFSVTVMVFSPVLLLVLKRGAGRVYACIASSGITNYSNVPWLLNCF